MSAEADLILDAVTDKLNSAADRIIAALDRLETELRSGKPSSEAVARVRQAVERLHNIVPEAEEQVEAEADSETDEGSDQDQLELGDDSETDEGVGESQADPEHGEGSHETEAHSQTEGHPDETETP